jgi:hypothetical protein
MNDSNKTKEQLIEELKALRSQNEAGTSQRTPDSAAGTGLTRRDVLSGWVAPVILTVPLIPRSGMAAAEGGGNKTGSDFTAFPTRLDIQADGPAGSPTNSTSPSFNPTTFQTPSTFFPTSSPTSAPTTSPTGGTTNPPTSFPTSAPTSFPTSAPTSFPTQQPTSSPTITIPVELTGFEVNG